MTERYKQAIAAGQAACARKDYAAARREFETALEIRPSFVPLVFEYARVCQKIGDKAAARDALRRVLFLDPSHKQALGAFSLLSLSSDAGADKELVRRIRANRPGTAGKGLLGRVLHAFSLDRPDATAADADVAGMTAAQKRLMRDAQGAALLGDYNAAVPKLETLFKDRPDDRRVLCALADATIALFAGGLVHDRLAAMVEKHPEDLALRTRLIRAAAQSERFGAAEELLLALSPEDRATPDGLLAEATVHYHNEEWDSALKTLAKLEALDDTRPDSAALHALILAESGRFDEAAPAFDEWAARAPNSPRMLMRASATRVLKKGTALFERAQSACEDPRLSQATRAAACFALVRAYKAAGDTAAEFDCLLKANELVDAIYDEASEEARIEAIARNMDAGICKDIEDSDRGAGLVFVCGLPRSGSTLVAQILAAHPDAVSIGESSLFYPCLEAAQEKGYPERIADFTRRDFADLGQQYLDALPKYARGARFVIDKELSKYQHMGLLSRMLPGARIVHTRRDHMDTCYSMFCQIFPGWPSAIYRQETLAHLAAMHDRITAHWAEILATPAYEIHYEKVVTDTDSEIRKLLDAVGMPFDESCLNFQDAESSVKTASSYQVRQKIYTGSIDAWKPHEEGLRPLRNRLAELGLLSEGQDRTGDATAG